MSDNRRTVAWQGWKLSIPKRWDPVKLEGDHAHGYALFADTLRPRLGLRWQTPGKKKFEPADAVMLAMKNEVGQLAADESRKISDADDTWLSPLLYIEPQPPGRDVYSVLSQTSNRLLQIAYHAHRREHILASSILPTLADLPMDRAVQWSIFGLNCVIPGGMSLKSQQLNAGDLGLTFADKFNQITVRQIAVAQLALQRQSLDGWLTEQQKISRKFHQAIGPVENIVVPVNGRDLPGRVGRMQRRLRYTLLWNQPVEYTTIALHDAEHDRLILLHGTDESLLRVVADSLSA